MTPLQTMQERIRLLKEVLSLTPQHVEEPVDFNALQQLVKRRQLFLDQLPLIDQETKTNPACVQLVDESNQLIKEILRRDQLLLQSLKEIQGKVRRLLQQVGSHNAPKAMLFNRTA